jgi:hypothetical protein
MHLERTSKRVGPQAAFKDEGKPKPRKRKPVSRKVSTKAKKRG